jgi:hypothetical protein
VSSDAATDVGAVAGVCGCSHCRNGVAYYIDCEIYVRRVQRTQLTVTRSLALRTQSVAVHRAVEHVRVAGFDNCDVTVQVNDEHFWLTSQQSARTHADARQPKSLRFALSWYSRLSPTPHCTDPTAVPSPQRSFGTVETKVQVTVRFEW